MIKKKKDFDYRQLCKNDIRNFSTLLDTPICHFYLSRSFPKYDLTTKISLLCGYGGLRWSFRFIVNHLWFRAILFTNYLYFRFCLISLLLYRFLTNFAKTCIIATGSNMIFKIRFLPSLIKFDFQFRTKITAPTWVLKNLNCF